MLKLKRTPSNNNNKKHDNITIKLIQKPNQSQSQNQNHNNNNIKQRNNSKKENESFFTNKKNQLLFILSIFWMMILFTLLNSLPERNNKLPIVLPILDKRTNRLLEFKKKLLKERKTSNRHKMTKEEMQFAMGRDSYGIVPPSPSTSASASNKKSSIGTTKSNETSYNNSDKAIANWIKKQESFPNPPKAFLRPAINEEKDHDDNDMNRKYCKCVDCATDKLCGGLWRGDLVTKPPSSNILKNNITVSVVLSHCNKSLEWFDKDFIDKDITISNITIISKCNQEVKNAPNNSVIVRLPNVGRCDHSYIYYMSRYKKEKQTLQNDNKHIHVFLKDSRFIHQDGDLRTLKDMLEIAYSNGFSCGLTCPYQMSLYHKTSVVKRFSLDMHRNTPEKMKFKSKYKNMGGWIDDMNISSYAPDPFMPVCYSGIFAVQTNLFLQYDKSFWNKLERSLSRGNSIEEGHFMERMWAALFSNTLKNYEIQGIDDYMETYNGACCYNGALMHDIYDDI